MTRTTDGSETLKTAAKTAGVVVAVVGLLALGRGAIVGWSTHGVGDQVLASLSAQSERAQATLFRLGELGSITDLLEEHYGLEVDASYDLGEDGRVLTLSVDLLSVGGPDADGNPADPSETATPDLARDFAREIARFAISKTTKSDHVDWVDVELYSSAETRLGDRRRESHRFPPGALLAETQFGLTGLSATSSE